MESISPRPPSIHTLTRLFLYLLFIIFLKTLLSSSAFSPIRLHPRGPSRHSVSTPPHALASPLSWTVPQPPSTHFPSPFLCFSSSLSVSLLLSRLSSSYICPSPHGLHPCRLQQRGGPSGTHKAGRAGRPRELVIRVSRLRTNGPVICVSHVTKLVSRSASAGAHQPAGPCSSSRTGTGPLPATWKRVTPREAANPPFPLL